MTEIERRLAEVRARIFSACERADRDPGGVTLVAVSKAHSAAMISEAYAVGQRDFGENRVQEGVAKIDALRVDGVSPAWHLLGRLQANKIRAALEHFDVLHAVDSVRLASAIGARASRPVRLFLEVNVGGEATKEGVAPEVAPSIADEIRGLANIDLIGLMTVAPVVTDPEDVRPVFRRLRDLRDVIGVRELSMGMTDDFEVAIEEGATFIRVGRAIFGPRPP